MLYGLPLVYKKEFLPYVITEVNTPISYHSFNSTDKDWFLIVEFNFR